MSFWNIVSWVLVAVLTGINIFVFLKLKNASEQMLKMAFPGAKNMNEALAKMQALMGQMPGGMGGMRGMPGGRGQDQGAQLRAAMNMLQQMKKGGKR